MTKFSSSFFLYPFLFHLLLSLTLVLVIKGQDGMPVLNSRYDLPAPDLFFCDTSEFLFRFDMSNVVENYMTKVHLSRGENCDIDIWDNNYLVPQVEYDLAPAEEGNFVRQISLVLIPDLTLIGNSPIYSVSADGVTGTLEFCVRLEVFTHDNTTRVNWRDVDYSQTTTLQEGIRRLEIKSDDDTGLDCSSGYDVVFENWWSSYSEEVNPVDISYEETEDGVGVMVGPSDKSMINQVNAELDYNLKAFECDENYAPKIIPVYEQGDLIRICITPDEVAAEDGLFMKKLDSMYFSKNGADFVQYAIDGGRVDYLGLSKFECTPGGFTCWIETVLRAEMFAQQGFVSLSGIGTLQFGSGSRRSLNNMVEDQRELQSQSSEERGKFTFKFPVTTFQETMVHHNSSSSNSVSEPQAILLVLLCFILITNCIFVFWIRQSRRIYNTIQGEHLLKFGKSRSNDGIDSTGENDSEENMKSHGRQRQFES